MATWYGTARSNYFRVKDEQAFKKDMAEVAGVDVGHRDSDDENEGRKPGGRPKGQPDRRFAIFDSYGEGWPNPTRELFDEEGDRVGEEEINLFALVASHLQAGEVAVFQQVGAEKQRYVTGLSVAVNHLGEELTVDIDDIYDKVLAAGWSDPTIAAH